MHQDKWIKKVLRIILIVAIFFTEFQYVHTAYAANLRFYNYNTESNVNYTGKQATYFYNNREIPLTTPGILINGTALADYEELFVQELGLTASRTDDTITLTDGKIVLILTLGSKKVQVNSEIQTMSVAPVKLKFDENTIKYYVPTRFVAEAFGLNYVWNNSTSSVKITKTLQLSSNEKTFLYNGTFYAASYENKNIPCSMPILYYNGQILAPAQSIFEAAGCSYEENEDTILITKGNISLHLKKDSDTAIVNTYSFQIGTTPVIITDQTTNQNYSYVPLEFVANMLGFELTYNDPQRRYTLHETEYTGNPELHPELKPLLQAEREKAEEEARRKYYFNWIAEETEESVTPECKTLSRVAAYVLEDTDVLELYGVTREDINDFIDNQTLVFELKSVLTNMGTQFFVDFNAPHINYVFMKTINNTTKLLFMIPIEDTWYFVENEDCVQVYFVNADLSLEDLDIAWEEPEEIVPEELPIIYPADKLVVPVPETIIDPQIQDKDNYMDQNFQIILTGNLVAFYEHNPILNPYSMIENITVEYDADTNQTVITCFTEDICGYKYSFENNYLAFTVGKPSEIFNKIVVLDAGHGGKDPGAVHNDVYEKDLNFSILYTHARELFENSDIKVYYTRETDVFIKLNPRAKFAKEVEADLFISLHMNASEYESASGTEVFYSKSNNKKQASGLNSYRLADTLANNLTTALGSRLRGVTKSDYYVVEHNSVPAVLIELGFISNEEECNKLSDVIYQKKAAEAIYQSVIEIFTAYPTGR